MIDMSDSQTTPTETIKRLSGQTGRPGPQAPTSS
jgi:hypothetical protein